MNTAFKKTKGTALGEQQKIASKGGVCPKCRDTYPSLTVEHIIPAYFLVSIGLAELVYTDADNMELLCKGCNGIKSARIDVFHPKTFPLLEKYVALSKAKYYEKTHLF